MRRGDDLGGGAPQLSRPPYFLLVEASILLDRFRAAVGCVAEGDPKFDVGSREVRCCTRFALRVGFERISVLKVAETAIVGLRKRRDRPEA